MLGRRYALGWGRGEEWDEGAALPQLMKGLGEGAAGMGVSARPPPLAMPTPCDELSKAVLRSPGLLGQTL